MHRATEWGVVRRALLGGRRSVVAIILLGAPGAPGLLDAQQAPGVASDATTARIALLDLAFYGKRANSLEPGDSLLADTATARVRDGLRSGGIALVDSAAVAAAEQSTAALSAATGRPCHVVVACARAVGAQLGVPWVVMGKVSKTSNLIWIFSGQLVDVGDGTLAMDDEYELKGNAHEMVAAGARVFARRVAKQVLAPADSTRPARDSTHDSTRSAADSVRLTRAEVLRRIAEATTDAPANLSGSDLSGLDLSGVDFKRADLTRSRLVGTRLARAQLFGVSLTDAVASGADFTDAVLDIAVLRHADLSRATLRGASLYATIMIGANMTEADCTKCRIIGALSGATLVRARLTGAHLGADPRNQPMGVMRTDLSDADLTGADLSGADLRKVRFLRADLTEADLSGADVAGAEFRDVRGRERIRGLAQARNLDKALFDTP